MMRFSDDGRKRQLMIFFLNASLACQHIGSWSWLSWRLLFCLFVFGLIGERDKGVVYLVCVHVHSD